MTPEDLGLLKTELTTDPQSVGYSADDAAAAAQLNDKAHGVTRLVPLMHQDLLNWGGNSGAFSRMQMHLDAANGLSSLTDTRHPTRSICMAWLSMANSGSETAEIDLNVTKQANNLALLVSDGVLLASDETKMRNKATKTTSRCEDVLGPHRVATAGDVEAARALP